MPELGDRAVITAAHRGAIRAARPDLADADLTLRADGWDCLAIEVAGEWIFKFPHHPGAQERLRREPMALDLIRPQTDLTLPFMEVFDGPPVMSLHRKVKGSPVNPDEYARLTEGEREGLAEDLAAFYAGAHGIDITSAGAVAASTVRAWPDAAALMASITPHVAPDVATAAQWVLSRHAAHGADEDVFGQFDTHGWNMAFDPGAGRLHGLFDFAGAGIGPLHRDLSYPMFVSLSLTARIVRLYSALTGRAVDLQRVVDCHGALRVVELAEACDSAEPVERYVEALLRFRERYAPG
ncbi:MAG: aminoglycoside phosphotransferase family protein [Pseudomonadota bacterium]